MEHTYRDSGGNGVRRSIVLAGLFLRYVPQVISHRALVASFVLVVSSCAETATPPPANVPGAPVASTDARPVASDTAPVSSPPVPAAANPAIGSAPSKVETQTFSSAALGVSKKYVVYLPKGYADSQHRFPLIVLLHGLGGNESNWVEHGGLQKTADSLSLEAVIVMPDGDDGFYANGSQPNDFDACLKRKPPFDPGENPATYCVRSHNYEDYIIKDLLAHVTTTYRTLDDRKSRGIGGLSMGGFGALSLAMRHTELFSVVASHSGMAALLYESPHPYDKSKAVLSSSIDKWGPQYLKAFHEHVKSVFGNDIANWKSHDPSVLAQSLDPAALAIHLDCGTSDDFHFQDHAAYLHDVLDARGVTNELALVPGVHGWKVWSAQLPASLAYFASRLAP